MYYIVALGNPGEKYELTRHNVGWQAMDHCLRAWSLPALVSSGAYVGRLTGGEIEVVEVKILYPDTFMNNVGGAVVKFVPKAEIKQLIVVHDDVDLPIGTVRVGKNRGAGGHNGVASVIAKVGSKEFIRVRIGIAPKSFLNDEMTRPKGGGPLESFVLKPFTVSEQKHLLKVYDEVKLALEAILCDGVEKAMNRVNPKLKSEQTGS